MLSTGNAFTEIRLDRSENTLIVGENGAGKSTILDALCYNLFGKPFRKVNLPTLVNSINNSDLMTESEFTIGTNVYRIRRGMKPTIFEIYKDDKLIDIPGTAGEYQDHLENFILHWNMKTFKQVVVLGNANFTPFMQLAAAERRAIIDDILDVQIFSAMLTLLKGRIDAVENSINENKHERELISKEISIKRAHIDQMKSDKQKELEELDNNIDETKKTIQTLEAIIRQCDYEIERHTGFASGRVSWSTRQRKASDYLSSIRRNLDKANGDIQFWSNTSTCPTCDQPIESDQAQVKIHACQDKVAEYANAIVQLETMIQNASEQLEHIAASEQIVTKKSSEKRAAEGQIRVHEQVIRDHERKKQAILDSHEVLDKSEDELMALEASIKALEAAYNELMSDLAHMNIKAAVLADKGIKADVVKQYLPVINKLINKYLAEQDFFISFELDSNFKEIIRSRYRDEFSYENFSEGEKQKIDLSLMLTWREVAKLKNSTATNVLILDEIFDSSLDAQSTEYAIRILNDIDRCNLFIISHKGDILQDKFRSVIKFAKVGNYSRII